MSVMSQYTADRQNTTLTSSVQVKDTELGLAEIHIQKIFGMPSGHTDVNDMCPGEIFCSQVEIETWIVQKVFKISSQHEDYSLTFAKSFPMIPNMWHFDDYLPNGPITPYIMCLFTTIMHPGPKGAANVNPWTRLQASHRAGINR